MTLTHHNGGPCAVAISSPADIRKHPDGGSTIVGRFGSVRVREARDVIVGRWVGGMW